jgi:DNA end-binding protein Ku
MAKKSAETNLKLVDVPGKLVQPSTTWTGFLQVGLISFPVKLHTGARAEKIGFNQLHRDCGSRLKMQDMWCPSCQTGVGKDEIVKGYEYRKGEFAIFEPEELENVGMAQNKVAETECFVPASEIDPIYYESSYFLSPGEGGMRPFHLVRSAMLKTGHVAIVRIVKDGREHVAVVRPYRDGLSLHTLFFESEVREMQWPADQAPASPAEMKLAAQLIEGMADKFDTREYGDGYSLELKGLIAAKLDGSPVKKVEPKKVEKAPVDLMSSLQASIAQARSKKKAA